MNYLDLLQHVVTLCKLLWLAYYDTLWHFMDYLGLHHVVTCKDSLSLHNVVTCKDYLGLHHVVTCKDYLGLHHVVTHYGLFKLTPCCDTLWTIYAYTMLWHIMDYLGLHHVVTHYGLLRLTPCCDTLWTT